MQSAAKLCRESNAAYQISPKPILDANEYAKKEVGGRGGAYKFSIHCLLIAYAHDMDHAMPWATLGPDGHETRA